MPANRFGIDMGEIYRTAAAVKGARTANKLSELKLSTAERVEAERPEKERVALERKNRLAGLRSDVAGGNVKAQQQLLALDPEGGPAFIDTVNKLDDRQIALAQKHIDQMGSMTASILKSSAEKRPALYAQMLTQLPEESVAKMPAEYDENFLNMSLAKQRAMDKILEVKAVEFGGKDILVKGGLEVGRADIPVKPGAGGAGGTKSADESLMYKQSAELLGGVFDQAGNITNLDPQVRNKVQAIATEAANLYSKAGGKLTRSESVKRAAKKYGVNVKDVPPENPSDPAGIRNYLLK